MSAISAIFLIGCAGSSGGVVVPDDAGRPAGGYEAGLARPPVTILVEPGDDGAALVQAIGGARASVHMTMYLLTSTAVINALVAQTRAGHEVKVLLNESFPGGAGSNSAAYAQLTRAGVQVRWAPVGFRLTHEKCVVLDRATAWIMTMNATEAGAKTNREYLAVDIDPEDVAEAEAIFDADWSNVPARATDRLVVSPTNARAKLVTLFANAKKSVEIEAEELSDATVTAALAAAQDRGAVVRIVLPSTSTQSAAQKATVQTLKQHGVAIVALVAPYVHAKAIVVDGIRAYVGSENLSASSLSDNRELGVVFDTPSEVGKVAATIARDFGQGTPL